MKKLLLIIIIRNYFYLENLQLFWNVMMKNIRILFRRRNFEVTNLLQKADLNKTLMK